MLAGEQLLASRLPAQYTLDFADASGAYAERGATLTILDEVRKARNDFAHRGTVPTHEVTTKALDGCFQLASLCASKFAETNIFDGVVSLIVKRCEPGLLPKKNQFEQGEVSHWLEIPPLPGDKKWGDKPYEVIEELALKPLPKSEEKPN